LTTGTKIENSVNLDQLLEFEVAFPNENPLTPEKYLEGGNKSMILKVASHFLGFKSQDSKFNNNRELLGAIFGPVNNDFANVVNDRINEIEKTGKKIRIISPFTSLRLFEYFFDTEDDIETQTEAEFERNLFKAYLILNSAFTKSQDVIEPSTRELDSEMKIPMMMFCIDYPVSDKVNFDIKQIWITQVVKAIYLFQFLELHDKTKPLLDAFLLFFKKSTWQDYLKCLLPLTLPAIQNEKEGHTDISVIPGENFEEDCAFIEKLIIQDHDKLDENDFLTIRAKPFYKIKTGVYRIIFNLFVVEKIFKGVYFLLRDVNNSLPKEHKFKEIKSFYGDEFSEKVLMYKVLEAIFPENCIRYSGKELSYRKIDGAPDYYVRKRKNILLFESKDFLIKAEYKYSFDFYIYEREFQRILYYEEMPDGSQKNKAVMQLINSIRRLLKKEFIADTDYFYRDVFIYPILLTHDLQYDTFGFNKLIDYWFQDELEGLKEEGLFIHRVKPLTVINIDSLIYHQGGLTEDITLNEVIDAYHSHISLRPGMKFKTETDYRAFLMSKFIPFSQFLNKYFNSKGINNIPPILDMVSPALFGEKFGKNDKIS
jgi:hypothetical protein